MRGLSVAVERTSGIGALLYSTVQSGVQRLKAVCLGVRLV